MAELGYALSSEEHAPNDLVKHGREEGPRNHRFTVPAIPAQQTNVQWHAGIQRRGCARRSFQAHMLANSRVNAEPAEHIRQPGVLLRCGQTVFNLLNHLLKSHSSHGNGRTLPRLVFRQNEQN